MAYKFKDMKVSVIVLLLLAQSCCAQSLEEWLDQRATKLKYLEEQVSANKVYLEWLEKGYSIAKDGLGYIKDAKNGEFHLHLDFFESLKKVNPRIKNSSKIASIIAIQLKIIKEGWEALQQVKEQGQFTAD